MPRHGNPDKTEHEPMPLVRRDAPVTVTLTGYAAEELRRVSRTQGAGTEQGLVTLATACVLRGLPYVEADLSPSLPKPRAFPRSEAARLLADAGGEDL